MELLTCTWLKACITEIGKTCVELLFCAGCVATSSVGFHDWPKSSVITGLQCGVARLSVYEFGPPSSVDTSSRSRMRRYDFVGTSGRRFSRQGTALARPTCLVLTIGTTLHTYWLPISTSVFSRLRHITFANIHFSGFIYRTPSLASVADFGGLS